MPHDRDATATPRTQRGWSWLEECLVHHLDCCCRLHDCDHHHESHRWPIRVVAWPQHSATTILFSPHSPCHSRNTFLLHVEEFVAHGKSKYRKFTPSSCHMHSRYQFFTRGRSSRRGRWHCCTCRIHRLSYGHSALPLRECRRYSPPSQPANVSESPSPEA